MRSKVLGLEPVGWMLALTSFLFRCTLQVAFTLCLYSLKEGSVGVGIFWRCGKDQRREFLSNQGIPAPLPTNGKSCLDKGYSNGAVNWTKLLS